MRKLFLSIFIMTNILLLAACTEAESEDEETNEETITPVEIEEVHTGDLIVEKTIYGHLSPQKNIPVMIQQPGEVSTLKVENGDKVEENDHLATIKSQMGSQAIYAPADGEIAQLKVQEDGFQSNEEPLALIVDLDHLDATFTVTPTMRDMFTEDEKVDIFVEDKELEGTVVTVDTMPNETGQFEITVELDNEDRDILPGMTVKGLIPEKRVKDAIIVPTAAIITESDESFVYTIEDSTAKKVVVDIKESQSQQSAIEADLQDGDQVVVSGQITLSDGSKVDVVKEGK